MAHFVQITNTDMKTLVLALLLALTAAAATPAQVQPATGEGGTAGLTAEQQRKYDYYFLESVRLKMAGKYDAAFCMLQHCLAMNPQAASAMYELAQYYITLRQPKAAMAVLEKAVQYDPGNYWYAQGLANLYMQQNMADKATTLLEDMVERFADKTDPLYNLLDNYNRAGEYAKAIGILERMEQRMGKNEQVSMEKFRIYLQKGDNKKAIEEIESLAEEYPKDLRYRVLLGDTYMQNDKREKALALYRDVLAEEPDNAMALYSMATYYKETGHDELYMQQMDTLLLNRKVDTDTKLAVMRQFIVENERTGGDSTAVIGLFDRILEQDPDDDQMPMLYVQYLMSKGMEKETIPVLGLLLDIDPTNTAARLTLLGEAVRNEDYEEVTRLCEAGMETNPDRLEFYFYLAIAYNQAGRTEETIDVCHKALGKATEKSDKQVLSDFYTIIGDAHYSMRQPEEAFAAYDSSLVYNPANYMALNNYAYYLSLERRDLDKAEEMSYKTIKAEPGNGTYLDTYAWILFEKGSYSEARIYIDDAMLTEEGQSAGIIEHGGDIYYMTGDTDKAVELWEKARSLGIGTETLEDKISQKKYIPYDNGYDQTITPQGGNTP